MSTEQANAQSTSHDGRRPPHPLIDRLLRALRYDRSLELWSFAQPLAPFAAEIQQLTSRDELTRLLTDLARLGYFLEVRRRSPDAARAIVELLRGVVPHLALELFEGGVERWRNVHARLQRELAPGATAAAKPPQGEGVGLRRRPPQSK